MARIIIGTILVLIGVSAFLGVSLVKFAIAFILIAIGVRILSGKHRKDWCWKNEASVSTSEDALNEVAIFSPVNKTVKSDNFKGGKIVMIFSGGQVDISQVKTLQKNINLEVITIFGGCKLIVPESWEVNSQGTAIFGGYNNKVIEGNKDVALNLKGAVIFGGMEIVS